MSSHHISLPHYKLQKVKTLLFQVSSPRQKPATQEFFDEEKNIQS